MSSTRTDPRGILLVCQCGNRFLVPHRLAGECVACTLCGAGLQVPARRSVHQVAADAVDTDEQKAFWRELVEEEGRAPSQEKKTAIQRPEEKASWWSDPRRRKKVAIGVIGAACLVVLAGIAAVMQRAWGTPAGWSPGLHHCEQGGYAIRLPSGLTARYSSETLGPDPRWKYRFDSVQFADRTRVGVVYMDILTEEVLTELSQGVLAFLQRDCLGDVADIDQCEIRLGRHPGRQMTYEHPTQGQRQSYARWFQVGNRLYGLLWISGYGQPSMSAVTQFLDSFQLLEEPSAEVTLVSCVST
jgi:hypothetical protein